MTPRISLTQYLVEQQRHHGLIPAQLRLLIEVVARACKRISISVNKGPWVKFWGLHKLKMSKVKCKKNSTSLPTRC